ncbi:MAG: carbamate kinase [Longimicrobiales bacterium]
MPTLDTGVKDEAPTIVVALGGNALLPAGERGEIQQQFAHTRESLTALVALARDGWNIAVVHGNGPQVGDGLLRNELARDRIPPLPLGVLVAATAGWIGYMIQQSLRNALDRAGVHRDVATLITQVLVDPHDPATHEPVKPIGRRMREEDARKLAEQSAWSIAESGDGWRRIVPSPIPIEIVERAQVQRLVASGTIVIAAGGGGTPVYRDPRLGLEGVNAVIDKDRAAEVLARGIGARTLLILTNVEGVFQDFGTPAQRLLRRLTPDEAETLLRSDALGRGSMAPKLEAALHFVRGGGRRAHIAALKEGLDAVQDRAGTTIVAGDEAV